MRDDNYFVGTGQDMGDGNGLQTRIEMSEFNLENGLDSIFPVRNYLVRVGCICKLAVGGILMYYNAILISPFHYH